jgi:hypothetical protein
VKKDQVRIDTTYLAKVSGAVVPVRIVQERWIGDEHRGWIGKNAETGRSVVIKSAQRLRKAVSQPAETPAPKAAKLAVTPVAGDVGLSGAGGEKVGTSAVAASPVPPKVAKAAKAKKGKKATAGQRGKSPKPAKAAKPKKDRPMSGLDAAAKVLADAGKPMRVSEIVAAAEKKGLWKSANGKTPEATVYAAIIREIFNKQGDSRFVKKDRGLFAAAGR